MAERDEDLLAARFEAQRAQVRGVAYRMLGSMGEAEDAVQETWLRLCRTDSGAVTNLGGWLTTVVSRVCLDLLRARAARREELVGQVSDQLADPRPAGDPEHEAELVDSVGRALVVVLDRLGPDERVAFVLHDLFAVPFDQIAPIVGRTTVAAKKLASRARGRVRGFDPPPPVELAVQRRLVDSFLAAARDGDLAGLLDVLAPDVVRTADPIAVRPGGSTVLRGARAVLDEAAVVFVPMARFAAPALLNGSVGLVVAPHGQLRIAAMFTVAEGRITGFDVIADPARLAGLSIALPWLDA